MVSVAASACLPRCGPEHGAMPQGAGKRSYMTEHLSNYAFSSSASAPDLLNTAHEPARDAARPSGRPQSMRAVDWSAADLVCLLNGRLALGGGEGSAPSHPRSAI